jgi:hypothetical protein
MSDTNPTQNMPIQRSSAPGPFRFGTKTEEEEEAIRTYLTCINADEGGFFFSRPYLRRGNWALKKGKQMLKRMEYQRRRERADQYRRQ